jgi:signal transduction histidine kinase
MGPRGLLALSVVSLVAVVVLDLHFWPDHNLAILYTVPVLLSSFIESAALVVAMSALVLLLDLLDGLVSKPPLGVWPLTFVALLVVCYLALEVAGQRALIRRQVEEATRARWQKFVFELLLVDVCQELRPPLTVILGAVQVLQRNPHLPGPLHGPVTAIEKSALDMRAAIDDLAQRWKPAGRDST